MEFCPFFSGDVGGNYKILYNDMFSQIRTILNHNIPILVYNGDTDLACNFLMGQKFSQMLGLKVCVTYWLHLGQLLPLTPYPLI